MEISYDDEADVLYITIRECENQKNVHRDDGVIISRDADTREIVGYTVMYFSEKEHFELPSIEEGEKQVPA